MILVLFWHVWLGRKSVTVTRSAVPVSASWGRGVKPPPLLWRWFDGVAADARAEGAVMGVRSVPLWLTLGRFTHELHTTTRLNRLPWWECRLFHPAFSRWNWRNSWKATNLLTVGKVVLGRKRLYSMMAKLTLRGDFQCSIYILGAFERGVSAASRSAVKHAVPSRGEARVSWGLWVPIHKGAPSTRVENDNFLKNSKFIIFKIQIKRRYQLCNFSLQIYRMYY